MVRAADLAFDELADRQVGPEMRAPGALHNRPARSMSISDDAGSKKIDPDDGPIIHVACEADGKPRPVKP